MRVIRFWVFFERKFKRTQARTQFQFIQDTENDCDNPNSYSELALMWSEISRNSLKLLCARRVKYEAIDKMTPPSPVNKIWKVDCKWRTIDWAELASCFSSFLFIYVFDSVVQYLFIVKWSKWLCIDLCHENSPFNALKVVNSFWEDITGDRRSILRVTSSPVDAQLISIRLCFISTPDNHFYLILLYHRWWLVINVITTCS